MSSSIDITTRKKAEESLIESEEKYRNLVSNIHESIFELDENGNVEYLSPQIYKISGYLPEEQIGINLRELIHPDDLKLVLISFSKLIQSGEIQSIDYRRKHKDGHYIYVNSSGRRVKRGDKYKIIGITKDITDHKNAEEQIKYQAQLVENVSDAIISTDNDFNIISWNKAAESIYDWKADEVIGRNVMDTITVEYPHHEEEDVLKEFFEKGFWEGEVIQLHKNGNKLNVYASVTLLKNSEGEPIGAVSINKDISERKKSEKKLKESEEKFRTLSEQSLVGIAIVQDNQMKYSNRKIAEIIEYPYEEIKDWTLIDHLKIVHPDHVDFVKEQAMKKQQGITDVMEDYEFCIYTKKGDLKWVHVFSKTISYEGRPADLVVQIDITKRKKIEEQLIKSEENYRVAYNNANFYKDLFAHDMNNILNSIRLSVELISETPKEREKMERFNKFFNIIKDSSNRGAQLISNVQKLSKLDESGAIIQDTNVSTYLKDAVSFIKNNFPNKDIEIEVDSLSEKILVMGNELLLDVFENIMINSVKYNDNKKKEILIKISEIQADGITFLKLEFIDNGTGIKHYRKEKIFEVGNREYKGVRGMGIGLYLV